MTFQEVILPIILALISSGVFTVILTALIEYQKSSKSAKNVVEDALKCLLRDSITKIYYRNKDDGTLEEYERKDLENLYDCYSRMGGNNYVHSLYEEMTHWPIKR